MANAYEAGAANLPFAMLRGYLGVDLPKVNPNIRSVTCPFTGEVLAAVPALRPDVGVIHAQRADREGNVLLEGITRRAEGGGARGEAVHRHGRGDRRRLRRRAAQRRHPAGLDDRPRSRCAGRRASVLRAGLLHARQRRLHRLGRDRARARHLPRLDEGERAGRGPDAFAVHAAAPPEDGPGKPSSPRRLHVDRDDDRRRGARAAQRATSASSASARRRPPATSPGSPMRRESR